MNKLQELRDYIDELHIRIDYGDYINLINLIDEIEEEMTIISSFKDEVRDRQLINLKKMIIEDASRRKEKIIAVDAETFKDVYGKEIHIKFSNVALESMKRDLEEFKNWKN